VTCRALADASCCYPVPPAVVAPPRSVRQQVCGPARARLAPTGPTSGPPGVRASSPSEVPLFSTQLPSTTDIRARWRRRWGHAYRVPPAAGRQPPAAVVVWPSPHTPPARACTPNAVYVRLVPTTPGTAPPPPPPPPPPPHPHLYPGTCTEFENGPFWDDLGVVLGVARCTGSCTGSSPPEAGGPIFCWQ
jgi:hypothetical protein